MTKHLLDSRVVKSRPDGEEPKYGSPPGGESSGDMLSVWAEKYGLPEGGSLSLNELGKL